MEERKSVMPIFGYYGENKTRMPISGYREEILQVVRDYQVMVIVGDVDCGITTQIPQYLYQDGSYTKHGKLIACVQPYPIVANTVAARVLNEMNMTMGEDHVPMGQKVIRFMAHATLLHEFLFAHHHPDDDHLLNYSVIVIDQAHERTLSIDILLGLLKSLARSRPDLKLIISTSALTCDAEKLSSFFDDAPMFFIPGGSDLNSVQLFYTAEPKMVDDYLRDAIVTTLQIHDTQPLDGDILVFLPGGQEELESAKEQILSLNSHSETNNEQEQYLIICTIYEYYSKMFHQPTPQGARKVFLVGDYADTWMISTMYGMSTIKYVIDSGFRKHKLFDPHTGIESFRIVPISKALAKQRVAALNGQSTAPPGKCIRLYTQDQYSQELEGFTLPEIQRTNLAIMVLILKSLGIDDLLSFNFVDRPPRESLNEAHELLYALGALDRPGQLTQVGRRMAELYPTHDPMLCKMIVASDQYNCSEEIITIAAMLISIELDGNSIFYRPKGKEIQADRAWMRFHEGNVGDHIALLKVYNDWRSCDYGTMWCDDNYVNVTFLNQARDIRDHLKETLEDVGLELKSSLNDLEAIKKAITAGFFPRSAARLHKSGSSYRTIGKHPQTVDLDPDSYFAKMQSPPQGLVIYHELISTTNNKYIRLVTELKPEWLLEVAPHHCQLFNSNTLV